MKNDTKAAVTLSGVEASAAKINKKMSVVYDEILARRHETSLDYFVDFQNHKHLCH